MNRLSRGQRGRPSSGRSKWGLSFRLTSIHPSEPTCSCASVPQATRDAARIPPRAVLGRSVLMPKKVIRSDWRMSKSRTCSKVPMQRRPSVQKLNMAFMHLSAHCLTKHTFASRNSLNLGVLCSEVELIPGRSHSYGRSRASGRRAGRPALLAPLQKRSKRSLRSPWRSLLRLVAKGSLQAVAGSCQERRRLKDSCQDSVRRCVARFETSARFAFVRRKDSCEETGESGPGGA